MLGKCCQLLARLSGQSGEKIRPLRKKICPKLNLTFWRYLAWELICKKFGPFSALSVQSRAKFGRSFVRPLMRQNNRPVGNTTVLSDGLEEIKAQLPHYSAHKIRIKLDFHSRLRSIQCQFCQFWLYTVKTFDRRINLSKKPYAKFMYLSHIVVLYVQEKKKVSKSSSPAARMSISRFADFLHRIVLIDFLL